MIAQQSYSSVADYIAMMNPQKVLEMRPSAEMQARIEDLIEKEKDAGLNAEEKDELDHYVVLERLIRLAKARAHFLLAQ